MITAARTPQHADLVQTFRRRCASAVADWLAGVDLHDTVDELAAWAARRGIVTDKAQRIMSAAFKPHRRPGDGGEPP